MTGTDGNKFRKRLSLGLGIVCLMFINGSATAQETGLGRWCDKAIPSMPSIWSTITIAVQADGSLAATVNYRDGSVGDRVLEESGGGVMMVVGSDSGDRYRIVPSTGDLQLLDNDGLIRIANRLENTPQAGECGS